MRSKKYYPIFLDLKNANCVVIGGGSVAERKVKRLLKVDARIKIISPDVSSVLKKWAREGRIRWLKSDYRKSHLKNARIVIGATNDSETNKRIFKDAERLKIPVNIADAPEYCRFIVPSIMRQKDIQIAVSTGGAAPAMAGRIRNEIERMIGEKYGVLVRELKKRRPRIKALPERRKKAFWKKIAGLRIATGHANSLPAKIDKWLTTAEKEIS